MTKEEMLIEGQFLGKFTGFVYDEHYVPNCKGEPITSNGFFMSPEFLSTIETIPKEVIEEMKVRAKPDEKEIANVKRLYEHRVRKDV